MVISNAATAGGARKRRADSQPVQHQQQHDAPATRTARLLVLGDRRVGKSATIVRFTTGRFIHEYCHSTQDWLYKRPVVQQANFKSSQRGQSALSTINVEVLEQKDLQFEGERAQEGQTNKQKSLSSRVALDLQHDIELYERQQLLRKIQWANAFVVIYSLTSPASFVKAAKYLSLVSSGLDGATSGEWRRQVAPVNSTTTTTNKILHKLTSANSTASCAPAAAAAAAAAAAHAQQPILLLANKRDLEASGARQVSPDEGRQLAARHRCLFAEISVSCESSQALEAALATLLEAAPTSPGADSNSNSNWSSSQLNSSSSIDATRQEANCGPQLVKWTPPPPPQPCFAQAGQAPIWSSLVRTRLPLAMMGGSHSSVQELATSAQASQTSSSSSSSSSSNAKRTREQSWAQAADVRLLTPVGPALVATGLAASGAKQQLAAAVCQPLLSPVLSNATLAYARSVSHQVAAPVQLVSSLETRPAIQPLKAEKCDPGGASARAGRYANFKSSFRKASMAIVSGKALASRAATNLKSGQAAATANQLEQPAGLKRNSTTPSRLNEAGAEQQVAAAPNQSSQTSRGSNGSLSSTHSSKLSSTSSWIKNRFSKQESSGSEGRLSSKSSSELQPAGAAAAQDQKEVSPGGSGAGGRFRRPLFKYKSRVKTVAFEPNFCASSSAGTDSASFQPSDSIQTLTTSSMADRLAPSNAQPIVEQENPTATTNNLSSSSSRSSSAVWYNSNRCSSTRSSSSLSTSDTYYSSLFIVCHENSAPAQQQQQRQQVAGGRPASLSSSSTCASGRESRASCERLRFTTRQVAANRKDSRSTLSRGSTSGGSYDEADEEAEDDEEGAEESVAESLRKIDENENIRLAAAQVPIGGQQLGNTTKPPIGPAKQQAKTRYQLVKTVQSTLTNLAKSTRAASSPASTPGRRSFCKALIGTSSSFSSSAGSSAGSSSSPTTGVAELLTVMHRQQTPVQVAQNERIQTIPAQVVGLCK